MVFNLKYEECSISFVTDTKWRPCYDIWDFIKGKYKSLSIYYQAEEPMENFFITNDKTHTFFPLKYVVDTHITDEATGEECFEREYFETQEKVLEWLNETFHIEATTLVQAQKSFYELFKSDSTAHINILECEIVE